MGQGQRRPPTIRDVARKAGVSLGTASNVLNGKASVDVKLRERVLAAARTLDFQLNGVARSLRRQRTGVVGLCVPMTTSAYFAALVEAFETAAASLGHVVMQVLSQSDPTLEQARVDALLARRVDGLILVPTADPAATLDLIAARRVPAVLVDRSTGDGRFDTVTIDDRAAMREAAGHLLALGHRRLLFVVRHPELVTTRARIESFHETLAAADAIGRVLVRSDDAGGLAADLEAELEGPAPPSAIIASNSVIAEWTLLALQIGGWTWPEDISVISFDEPPWCELVQPPLTCVRQPVDAIACTACELLLARLEGTGDTRQDVVLPVSLVIRGSTAPPGSA